MRGVISIGLLVALGIGLGTAGKAQNEQALQSFVVRGIVEGTNADGRTIIVRHEAISNYMDTMTMPFKAKDRRELAGLEKGDEISFRLQVSSTESRIDRIRKAGARPWSQSHAADKASPGTTSTASNPP